MSLPKSRKQELQELREAEEREAEEKVELNREIKTEEKGRASSAKRTKKQ